MSTPLDTTPLGHEECPNWRRLEQLEQRLYTAEQQMKQAHAGISISTVILFCMGFCWIVNKMTF